MIDQDLEAIRARLAYRAEETAERLQRESGRAMEVARRGKSVQAEVARLREQGELQGKVAALLTTIGEQRQESARAQVEGLVTRALQVVFDSNLSFHMVQAVRANRAEVDFVIRSAYKCQHCTGKGTHPYPTCLFCGGSGDIVVDTPVMDARGGGTAAVVGFVLRLVVLLLTPRTRRFLALDESFAHVSASYEPRVAEFLREVADKAGVQILLITHSDAYSDMADVRYRFSLGPDGTTVVEKGTEHG
jgi:hypothetical protein